jgi:hypothetical protein
MTPVRVLDLPADRMEGEAVAAFFFEDERPLRGPAALLDWRLNGALTDLLLTGQAAGRAGEHILFPNNGKLGADWVFFVGGGSRQGLGEETYGSLIRHVLAACRDSGFARVALCLAPLPNMGPAILESLVTEIMAETAPVALECLLTIETESPGRTSPRRR